MPASPEEVEEAVTEGINLQFLTSPTRISANGGKVDLVCSRMSLGPVDSSGRRRPETIKDSEFTTSYDNIIAAVGQQPEVPKEFTLAVGRGNVVTADADTVATGKAGIFAGGDATTGPASVIEAIASGRQAAVSIDRYLGGKGIIDMRLVGDLELPALEEAEEKCRPKMPLLPMGDRVKTFRQVELGYGRAEAVEEASRCLRCDKEKRD
jgi:NADPH-dependent glutamate synthase beta subunit-like oxidoreductase